MKIVFQVFLDDPAGNDILLRDLGLACGFHVENAPTDSHARVQQVQFHLSPKGDYFANDAMTHIDNLNLKARSLSLPLVKVQANWFYSSSDLMAAARVGLEGSTTDHHLTDSHEERHDGYPHCLKCGRIPYLAVSEVNLEEELCGVSALTDTRQLVFDKSLLARLSSAGMDIRQTLGAEACWIRPNGAVRILDPISKRPLDGCSLCGIPAQVNTMFHQAMSETGVAVSLVNPPQFIGRDILGGMVITDTGLGRVWGPDYPAGANSFTQLYMFSHSAWDVVHSAVEQLLTRVPVYAVDNY